MEKNLFQTINSLHKGAVIAYPTESVWALGCDPHNITAIKQLLSMKGREESQGFILVAGAWQEFSPYFPNLFYKQIKLIKTLGTHPCSWLVEDTTDSFPVIIRGEHPKIAIRISHHKPIKKFTRLYGKPLVSTSANPSGQAPARTIKQLTSYFGEQISCVLPGPLGGWKNVSHIRDLETGKFLRFS